VLKGPHTCRRICAEELSRALYTVKSSGRSAHGSRSIARRQIACIASQHCQSRSQKFRYTRGILSGDVRMHTCRVQAKHRTDLDTFAFMMYHRAPSHRKSSDRIATCAHDWTCACTGCCHVCRAGKVHRHALQARPLQPVGSSGFCMRIEKTRRTALCLPIVGAADLPEQRSHTRATCVWNYAWCKVCIAKPWLMPPPALAVGKGQNHALQYRP
jgi:hypothetical protein